MTCRRAYEVDLAAFLQDPRDAAWDEFRAHYPRCPECSSEVAAWTVLHAALVQHHPEPEALLRFGDDPGTLAPDQRATLARHLEQCPSCRDELRALDRFAAAAQDPAAVVPPAPAHPASAARRGGRHGDVHPLVRPASARAPERTGRRRAPGGALRRVLWHPAFAYAALTLVLLLPTVRAAFDREAGRGAFEDASSGVAEQQPVAGRSEPDAQRPRQERPPIATSEDRASAALADGPDDARIDRTAPRLIRQAPPQAAVTVPGAEVGKEHSSGEPAAPARRAAGGDALRALSSALDRDATIRLLPGRDGATRTLVVTLPARLGDAAVLEVRIRDEDGARELRQRVERTAGANAALTLALPAGFTAPRLVVEVYADGIGPVAQGIVTP